jgi:glyoxylase-like metal-dependent hydrolase (beta-lactamase superfamily II)
MQRFRELVPGVLVATEQELTTNSTAVAHPGGGCLLIDPAVSPADLAGLAADLAGAGLAPRAGFATHPHWDHVLWSRALGDVPRYAAAAAAALTEAEHDLLAENLRTHSPGHDLDLAGRLTALPGGTGLIPWDGPEAQLVVHDGHAPGHAAVFFPHTGVLVAWDMLSDLEIPILATERDDALAEYRTGLGKRRDRKWLAGPGHGQVTDAGTSGRVDADRRYLDWLEAASPRRRTWPARLARGTAPPAVRVRGRPGAPSDAGPDRGDHLGPAQRGRGYAAFRPGWPEFIFHDPDHQGVHRPGGDYFPSFDVLVLDAYHVVMGLGVPLAWRTVPGCLRTATTGPWSARSTGRAGRRRTRCASWPLPCSRPQHADEPRPFSSARSRADRLLGDIAPRIPRVTLEVSGLPDGVTPEVTWDGQHIDPWIRTHQRLGAAILAPAPRSMIITGTVAEWEEWAAMAFPETGGYVVPHDHLTGHNFG